MSLFMGTTTISAERTAGQVAALLVSVGANAVLQEFQDGEVSSLSFVIPIDGRDVSFRLPVRVDPIFAILQNDRRVKRKRNRAHATRVAWRQVFRWVEAQLAMIEVEMVDVAEVFLPYVQTKTGATLYQAIAESGAGVAKLIDWRPAK